MNRRNAIVVPLSQVWIASRQFRLRGWNSAELMRPKIERGASQAFKHREKESNMAFRKERRLAITDKRFKGWNQEVLQIYLTITKSFK